MNKIDLRVEYFKVDLFWNWSFDNLKSDIWFKLRRGSFKGDEIWAITARFNDIR